MTATPFSLSLRINGEDCALVVPTHRTLLEVLRNELALTGTKQGCNAGTCGSCNVLVDDKAVRSCLCLAASVSNKNVTTVEGLTSGPTLSLVQQAFLDAGAIQCGFCMPGLIISATALLAEKRAPTRDDIRTAISGNLCRCSGYVKVIEAIELAVTRRGAQS